MKLFFKIFLVFTIFISIILGTFYTLVKIDGTVIKIEKNTKLESAVCIVQTYDTYLDSLGFNYQLDTTSYYLGWEVNSDLGLYFKFMNQNESVYKVGYKTIIHLGRNK